MGVEKRALNFMRFFSLLLKKDDEDLSDEEIAKLISVKRQLIEKFDSLQRRVSIDLELIQRYRKKKKELAKLSTEQLERMDRCMRESWAAAIESHDDFYDEGGDSLYEPPAMDSDDHIVYELLEERRKEQK